MELKWLYDTHQRKKNGSGLALFEGWRREKLKRKV
jgi:hypothetical protein